jgi:hypothetical protein
VEALGTDLHEGGEVHSGEDFCHLQSVFLMCCKLLFCTYDEILNFNRRYQSLLR